MGKSSGNSGQGDMMSAFAAMQQAQMQYQLGHEQLQWARDVYNEQKPYIMDATKTQLDAMHQANDFAKQQQDFYTQNYQPMEKDFIDTANSWDTPERQRMNAGAAEATVASRFDQARTAALHQLESFGVDPSSTRAQALDVGTRAQQAAASASAGNTAIQNTINQGLALKSQAINVGRGYATNINQGFGTGVGAGSAAVSGLNNELTAGANAQNSAVGWFNAGNNAMGNAINAWGNYDKAYQASQNQSSGIGSILGAGMGLLKGFMFEDGGPVPDVNPEASPDRYTGAAIPTGASPSQGRAIDDVPARLNVGEFVVPEDVVKWEGEKAMYSLVERAQKERAQKEQTTHIRPDVRQIPAQPQMQPQRQAIAA